MIIRLICATETANSAGTIFFSMRRTPGSPRPARGFHDRRGSMPIFTSDGTWIATCKTPPTMTAMAIA
ncbi:hypothetical protein D3C86_2202550 [compost metagenome]